MSIFNHKVLIFWEEPPDRPMLYLVEATDEQLEVLKSVDGCYVNHVEVTQEQEDTLLKIASALWDGVWKDCEIKTPYEFNAVDRLHFVVKMGLLM